MKFLLWIPTFRRWYDAMRAAEDAAADWQGRWEALAAEMRELRAEYTGDLKKIADYEAMRASGRNIFARASEMSSDQPPAAQPKGFRMAREVIWDKQREIRDQMQAAKPLASEGQPS